MTAKEIRKSFWDALQDCYPDLYSKGKRSKPQNEQVADIRMAFCEYIERLRIDGEITEKQAYNITL